MIESKRKPIKLKWRILIGYAIPILLSFGVVGVIYSKATTVVQLTEQMETTQLQMEEIDQMIYGISQMLRNVRMAILYPQQEDYEAQYRQNLNEFKRKYDQLMEQINDSSIRDELASVLEASQDIDRISKNVFELINNNQLSEAREQAQNLSTSEIRGTSQNLDQQKQNLLNQKYKDLEAAMNTLTAIAAFGTILAASLAVALALFISSRISRTINDSVSVIASSSNQIATTTEEQERNASQQAGAINETTATMDELGEAARSTAEQAESSAESARQVLTLAKSSIESAQQVLNLGQFSSESAQQVLKLAQSETEVVQRTLEKMLNLKEKVEAIAHQIVRLSQQTEQIGMITNMAADLANQTNMLSLNAAVEAARAGVHGKGFAVVATEIRKLADQSKQSAEKITTLVNNIQTAIDGTVSVTDEGSRTAKEAIELSQGTVNAFEKVTEAINPVLKASTDVSDAINHVILNNQEATLGAINEVVLNSQQISLSSQQQAQAIQQVFESMNNLNQSAVQTANGLRETKIGIQRLNEVAQNLKAET